MQLNYLTTAIQGVNAANDMADFFLTPLRELVDGYQFEATYGFDAYDCYGPLQNVRAVSDRVDFFAQNKVFALILVAAVVPTLLGIAFKILAAIGGAFDEYEKVERYINNHPALRGAAGGGGVHDQLPHGESYGQSYTIENKQYCLDLKGMGITPAEVEQPQPLGGQIAEQLYSLDRYAKEWDNLAWEDDKKTRRPGNFADIRRLLAGIPGQVANTAGYWAVKGGVNDADTRAQVQTQMTEELRGILQAFDNGASHVLKVETLVKLAEAARVCTPTLIDEAHKSYMRITSRGIADMILVLIQTLKENIVLQMVQQSGYGSWHSINPVRHRYGVALGLMVGSMKMDSAWSVHDRPMKLSEFLKVYTVEAVVNYVQSELNKFNFSDDICMYLMQHHHETMAGQVAPREAFFLPVPKDVLNRWMNDPLNVKQKKQYEEAVKVLAAAEAEIVAAQGELAKHVGDNVDEQAKADAQQRLEAAQSKQELYVEIPKQYEVGLRTQISEEGVLAMLECLGIVLKGDIQVTARMLGFSDWND